MFFILYASSFYAFELGVAPRVPVHIADMARVLVGGLNLSSPDGNLHGRMQALVCLAAYCAAWLVRPASVTRANAQAELQRYPPDGVLFLAADCRTCHLPRPARSKHCCTF